MNSFRICLVTALMGALLVPIAPAQQDTVTPQVSGTPAASATVPRLIRMRGSLVENSGKPVVGQANVQFSLYRDQAGGPALWQETQSVQLDATGHYEALLGATSQEGLPLSVFTSGEARWLGVQVEGQPEQPRVLLLSVAYALKAADAETLGGKPASAYMLAGSQNVFMAVAQPNSSVKPSGAMPFTPMYGGGGKPATPCTTVSADGTGTANQVVKFTDACDIQNSAIFESGGNVGIGNTSPAGVLDVSGNTFIRGSLTLPATGTATSATPWPSYAFDLLASSFSSTSSSAVAQDFRWMAEPAGNNTANPSGTLNLLFGSGGNTPSETGLSIGANGVIMFAPNQTFPGAGSGTVTSVGTGSGLTGGPITGSGTIGIANGGITNLMLANPFVTVQAGSGLSGGGPVALGGTITLTNTAPSSGGTVTSVASGTGLSGGPITGSGTLSLNTGYTDARYLQLAGGTLIGGLNGTTANFASTVQAGGIVAAPLGTATPSQAFTASPLDSQASVYNTSVSKAAIYFYRWEAEPFGNNSSSTGANLNLLFGTPGLSALETGLSINRNGIITFAPGQTFPGGSGTVTSVATGAGLTGGPITTSGTISIPPAGVVNSMLANPSITVQAGTGLSGGGTVALGGTVTLNSTSSGGTITGVTAGSGLQGGGSSGNVTLSLLQTCSAGQVLAWSGASW
ncbi:MAG: hypothetical protein JOY93_06855, partial [Acidobacteriales bacterium]|nr:hypothetical protein [Terriglobales bacterium]